jgi:NAD(P)-dependent dehydrogenase (short-subunit alcohol dehydrogenase family)
MAGRLGLAGGAADGATEAALASFTQAWAAEYSPRGVRVNAVAPGPIYTPPEARELFDTQGPEGVVEHHMTNENRISRRPGGTS